MTHTHDHIHADDAPIRLAKHGNLILGAIGLAVGFFSGSGAAFADGAHKVTDALAHDDHIATAEAERHADGSQNEIKFRKRAAILIGAGALLAGGYSVHEFVNSEPEYTINGIAAASELGSICLAGTVAYKFSRQNKKLAGQVHSQRHNLVDLGLSTVSLAGIVATPAWQYADSVAGISVSAASLMLGVQLYRDKIH
jgi:divalent metal cation (Fe/Co/Zn/Cd) transporter